MATKIQGYVESKSTSDTRIMNDVQNPTTKTDSPESPAGIQSEEDDLDYSKYPAPWKWEKFLLGGYSQNRMLKFSKPKTMYLAINLFAGVAIMFYGYD